MCGGEGGGGLCCENMNNVCACCMRGVCDLRGVCLLVGNIRPGLVWQGEASARAPSPRLQKRIIN